MIAWKLSDHTRRLDVKREVQLQMVCYVFFLSLANLEINRFYMR